MWANGVSMVFYYLTIEHNESVYNVLRRLIISLFNVVIVSFCAMIVHFTTILTEDNTLLESHYVS